MAHTNHYTLQLMICHVVWGLYIAALICIVSARLEEVWLQHTLAALDKHGFETGNV